MNDDDLRIFRFLEKHVYEIIDIGLQHAVVQGRLFYYTGRILNLKPDYLMLQTDRGLKRISIDSILEVRLHGEG